MPGGTVTRSRLPLVVLMCLTPPLRASRKPILREYSTSAPLILMVFFGFERLGRLAEPWRFE